MSEQTVPEPHTRPENPAAIIALIAGLLICVPGTGLIAIIAGIVGRRRSRLSQSGHSPATFGLVLGVINIMLYTAVGVGAFLQYRTMVNSEPAVQATKQLIVQLGSGNVSAARGMCEPSITLAQLTDAAEQLDAWGALQSVDSRYGGEIHSNDDIEVQAALHYAKLDKLFVGHWKMQDHVPRLMRFDFQDPPSTQPTTVPAKQGG